MLAKSELYKLLLFSGGAYEMCGVALHATGGPRREVESYIDQAYNAYVKVRKIFAVSYYGAACRGFSATVPS